MIEVRLSEAADRELQEIEDYLTREASPRVAVQVAGSIRARIDGLAHHPRSGPLRPNLGPETRIALANPYVVIYRVIDLGGRELVFVLRIVHGARDYGGA